MGGRLRACVSTGDSRLRIVCVCVMVCVCVCVGGLAPRTSIYAGDSSNRAVTVPPPGIITPALSMNQR
jgi:hypothetical protein